MPSPLINRPFLSSKNVPLWICAVLMLTFGVLGIVHHRPGAEISAAAAAR